MIPIAEFMKSIGVQSDLIKRWGPHIEEGCQRFGIAQDKSRAAFVAQMAVESGMYRRMAESFDYSINGLIATFPKRINPDLASKLGRKANEKFVPIERQQAIANIVYANRLGNRDAASGDGWRYRGGGLKQITGHDNYLDCAHALGVDVLADPDLLRTNDALSAMSAAWFWWSIKGDVFMARDDIDGLSRRINGGNNGLDQRRNLYAQTLKNCSVSTA